MSVDTELAAIQLQLIRAAQAGEEAEDALRPFLEASNRRLIEFPKLFGARSEVNQMSQVVNPGRDQRRRAREIILEFMRLAEEAHRLTGPDSVDLPEPLFELPQTAASWAERVSMEGGRKQYGPRFHHLADEIGSVRAEIQRVANHVMLLRHRRSPR